MTKRRFLAGGASSAVNTHLLQQRNAASANQQHAYGATAQRLSPRREIQSSPAEESARQDQEPLLESTSYDEERKSEATDNTDPPEISDVAEMGEDKPTGRSRLHLYSLAMFRERIDNTIRKRNLLIALNAFFGIGLMCWLLWHCWDATEAQCVLNDGDILPQSILTITSLLLVYQIMDVRAIEEFTARSATQFTYGTHGLTGTASRLAYRQYEQRSALAVLNCDRKRLEMWAQIIVCLWHPFPGHEFLVADPSWCLFMFCRTYIIALIVRDHSDLYRHRWQIKRIAGQSVHVNTRTLPKVGSWLAAKELCYRHPLSFSLFCVVYLGLVWGYCIFTLERSVVHTPPFDLKSSIYLAVQCVITGYASDTFGVYNPQNRGTQYACICATLSGLFVTSFLIGIVAEAILPNSTERVAVHAVQRAKLRFREKDAAARLIQLVWRSYRRHKDIQSLYQVTQPDLYLKLSDREDEQFLEALNKKCKIFQKIASMRMELDVQLGIPLTLRKKKKGRKKKRGRGASGDKGRHLLSPAAANTLQQPLDQMTTIPEEQVVIPKPSRRSSNETVHARLDRLEQSMERILQILLEQQQK